MISKRTKAAFQVAKMRGTRLDNPNPLPASQDGIKALEAKTAEYHATVSPLIRELRQQGMSLSAIAAELTRRPIPAGAAARQSLKIARSM